MPKKHNKREFNLETIYQNELDTYEYPGRNITKDNINGLDNMKGKKSWDSTGENRIYESLEIAMLQNGEHACEETVLKQ